MTAAELTVLQRKLRQMLPDLGISAVLAELKKALPEHTTSYNTVFQIETRLNAVNKDRIRGILAQEDLELAYNRLNADTLDLIDALKPEDFDISTAISDQPDKSGSILYRIPRTMEVEEEYRCVIRLAFDDETVVQNIELTRDTVVKDVRVSEVMEVELLDPNSTPCFAIRRLNSLEQFLEKNAYTEWIFYVKPLITGEFPLVLKVSVKELIQDKERTKEIVLEEIIHVIAEPAPDESSTFQNAGYVISYSSTPEDKPAGGGSVRRSPLLLILGLIIASGLLAAGINLGWIPVPEWLHAPKKNPDDLFWEKMSTDKSRSRLETYLLAYPEGKHVQEAKRMLDSLAALQQTLPLPAPPVVPESIHEVPEPIEPASQVAPAVKEKRKIPPAPGRNAAPNNPAPAPVKTEAPVNQTPAPATAPGPELPNTGSNNNGLHRKSGFDMVNVAGGNFKVDARDCPAGMVVIRDFKLGKYEITQADWREIMGSSPSFHSNCSDCPVEKVSWDEIQRFIKIAQQKRGRRYRLPTEAEWEYAARGGLKSSGKKYAGGNDPNSVAWFNIIQEKTHAVGEKRANELGIFDMSGNVWEWCDGAFPAYLLCKTDGNPDKKALRGGSWADKRSDVTVDARRREKSGNKDRRSGFRLIEVQ